MRGVLRHAARIARSDHGVAAKQGRLQIQARDVALAIEIVGKEQGKEKGIVGEEQGKEKGSASGAPDGTPARKETATPGHRLEDTIPLCAIPKASSEQLLHSLQSKGCSQLVSLNLSSVCGWGVEPVEAVAAELVPDTSLPRDCHGEKRVHDDGGDPDTTTIDCAKRACHDGALSQ